MPDGTILSIYSHFDGYPSGVGATLKKYYTKLSKIKQLIELGNISSLRKKIGTQHDFDSRPHDETNAYGRDRGEEGQEAIPSFDVNSFL